MKALSRFYSDKKTGSEFKKRLKTIVLLQKAHSLVIISHSRYLIISVNCTSMTSFYYKDDHILLLQSHYHSITSNSELIQIITPKHFYMCVRVIRNFIQSANNFLCIFFIIF